MLDDLLGGVLGGLLAGSLGRAGMTSRSATSRRRKFDQGHWFMIPLEIRVETTYEGGSASAHVTMKRRFEVRINARSQSGRGYLLGWWDEALLGTFPSFLSRSVLAPVRLDDGLLELPGHTLDGRRATLRVQDSDLEILQEVCA